MALNLYLDDCANSDLLAELLTQAGHTVARPADAGLTGDDDHVHLAYAVRKRLIVVTKNPDDFYDYIFRIPSTTASSRSTRTTTWVETCRVQTSLQPSGGSKPLCRTATLSLASSTT